MHTFKMPKEMFDNNVGIWIETHCILMVVWPWIIINELIHKIPTKCALFSIFFCSIIFVHKLNKLGIGMDLVFHFIHCILWMQLYIFIARCLSFPFHFENISTNWPKLTAQQDTSQKREVSVSWNWMVGANWKRY